MLLVSPLLAIGYIVQSLSEETYQLNIGRFISGIAGGLACGPGAAYVTEVSDSRWRTTFNSGLGICCLVGTVCTYVLGAILHWRTIIYISCIYPCGSFIIAVMVPESPPWLITKGRLDEAKKGLLWLYSHKNNKEAIVDAEI